MGSIVGVDGRDCPVVVLMVIASRLKLPGTEKADLLVFRRPQGRSFAEQDRSTAANSAQSVQR
jgi:hypothetical protein